MLGTPTFRPGQVIRFTYFHPPAGIDANTRSPQKEIFVLHTRWGGKVHGIDLKVLSPAQIDTLKAIMDPRNNRMREAGYDAGVGEDFINKIRNPQRGDYTLQQLKDRKKNLDKNIAAIRSLAAIRKGPDGKPMKVAPETEERYHAELVALQEQIENFEVQQATPDQQDQRKLAVRPLTPMARQILQQVLPARIINNPKIFYNLVVRRLIGGVDAYRTFYRGRMTNVQVDPRWFYVAGAGNIEAGQMGITPREKGPQRLFKAAGQIEQHAETPGERQRRMRFIGKYNQKPVFSSTMSGGVMKSMGSRSGTNIKTVQPTKPIITKAPKNK